MENIGLSKKVDKFNGFCTSNTYYPYLCVPYKFPHQVYPEQPISESKYNATKWDLLSVIHSPLRSLPFLKQVKTHRLEKKAQPWDSMFVKTEYCQTDNCIIHF